MKSLLRPVFFVARWVRQHWKLSLFLLLVIGGGIWFWRSKVNKPPEQLHFETVKKEKLIKTLNISGTVEAKQKAILRFVAGGKIVYLGAKEGQWVKRGQTIATIDSRSLQKLLAQELNQFHIQRMDFDQNNDVRQDQAPTDAANRASQQDQKALENAVLDVEIQDIAVRNNVLSTPIAGILVSAPTAVSGVTLTATDVFEVVDPASLVFKATVEETDMSLVKKGQPAEIELDAYPEAPITATVSAIAYRSSQTTKGTVFLVELPITGEEPATLIERYRLGMNGDVLITVDERESALQIPIDALIERDDKTYVQKKTGENTAEEVEIKIGIETDEMVEVLEGLQEGDQVVIP
jgi:RND family efflux transporter MFP subunit